MDELERFESTFVVPGFGAEPHASGRVVEYVLAHAAEKGLHVLRLEIRRGAVTIAGDAEPGKLKSAVVALQREIGDVIREAKRATIAVAPSAVLPRSAEG